MEGVIILLTPFQCHTLAQATSHFPPALLPHPYLAGQSLTRAPVCQLLPGLQGAHIYVHTGLDVGLGPLGLSRWDPFSDWGKWPMMGWLLVTSHGLCCIKA
jgi:hypothetical protein